MPSAAFSASLDLLKTGTASVYERDELTPVLGRSQQLHQPVEGAEGGVLRMRGQPVVNLLGPEDARAGGRGRAAMTSRILKKRAYSQHATSAPATSAGPIGTCIFTLRLRGWAMATAVITTGPRSQMMT